MFLCTTINFFSSYLPPWPCFSTSLPAHMLPPPGCAGTDMMGKMLKMQMLEDEDDLAYDTEKKERTASTSDAQPAWMRTLHTTACNWLQLMPQTVNPLKRTVENIKVMAELRGESSRDKPKISRKLLNIIENNLCLIDLCA